MPVLIEVITKEVVYLFNGKELHPGRKTTNKRLFKKGTSQER